MVERGAAYLGEHRLQLRRHRHHVAGGHEPGRRHAVRGHDLHLLDRGAGQHRAIRRRDIVRRHEPVLVLDQQPVLRVLGAHQGERALHLLAAQEEAQLPFRQPVPRPLFRLRAIVEPGSAFVRRVDAAVPDDHLSRPVLAGRYDPLERRIIVGVVLDVDREALVARIERRPLGAGPGLQDAVALEPDVIMQSPGGVLLDDEEERAAPLGQRRRRLGRGVEGPLGGVLVERRGPGSGGAFHACGC